MVQNALVIEGGSDQNQREKNNKKRKFDNNTEDSIGSQATRNVQKTGF